MDHPESIIGQFNPSKRQEYTAVLVGGQWLWFTSSKTREQDGFFIGDGGWGKGGAYTNLRVKISEVTAAMESDWLNYGEAGVTTNPASMMDITRPPEGAIGALQRVLRLALGFRG